ncbi:Trk family potassium uptake protein [Candidatus Poribacteria bacterium]|nr:Trk family potassium uptake protein [Candidatus Poribacteria bacterium]
MQINRAKFQSKLLHTLDLLMVIVAMLAIVSLIIEVGGFDLSMETKEQLEVLNWIIIALFLAEHFIRWGVDQFSFSYLKKHWFSFSLVFIFVFLLIIIKYPAIFKQDSDTLRFVDLSVTRAYVIIVRLYILVNLLIKGISTSSRIARANLPAAQIVSFSFIFVILFGTIFLMLPGATKAAKEISFVDALFTATSATCVTGLIVVDTGSFFSRFGQIVILILIQIGGLGLMTMTAFFSIILGRSMSVKESVLMSDVLSSSTLSKISHMIVSILILTFVFEALGILSFYLSWSDVNGFEHGSILYYSVFHSVSAFCNAGFSLFSDSFSGFKDVLSHNMTVTSLIIFGGLGFTVLMNVFRFLLFKKERLSLQTKLVLLSTACLIAVGTILILVTEWDQSLKELPLFTKILTGYFQSVTTRTAGFNTINIGGLTNACYFLMMILMFIGASPGSTGGGIKTSTFSILVGSILSMLKGRESLEMFRRNVPREIVNKALSVVILALALLAVFGFVLLFTEKADPMHILFEMVSAFGTVGLSAGLTPNLSFWGKIVIITTMFIGRIGPLTLALAIGQRQERVDYEYPDEAVMIG